MLVTATADARSQGLKHLRQHPLPSSMHQQQAGLEAKQLGLKQALQYGCACCKPQSFYQPHHNASPIQHYLNVNSLLATLFLSSWHEIIKQT